MTEIDVGEKALAGYVALRIDDWTPKHGCPAWIESKDRQCGRQPVDAAMLCKRHRNIALKRLDEARRKRKQQDAERERHRAKMLPEWRAERERVEALMDRYGGLPTTDRAAYGGVSHPSIQKAQMRQLSDTNVKRMAKLSERAQELRRKIGDDK